MIPYSKSQLASDAKAQRISQRLMRSLHFSPENITDWDERDFLAIANKSGGEGLLLFHGMLLPYELMKRKPSSSGRTEPIICDFCRTWRRGSESAIVTMKKGDRHTVSYLVCADLDCSLHVRDKTDASKLSRTQLREHIRIDERIVRLVDRLTELTDTLEY